MADDDSNNALSCKLVLLGESGVGKTSIISRYTTNTFSSILMSTTGASFATKTMMLEDENQSVKFEIWEMMVVQKLYQENIQDGVQRKK